MITPTFVIAAALAGVVFYRVGSIASRASRARFGCHLRFQGFALGYGVLGFGAMHALIEAWKGTASLAVLALLAASALLILFDRRKPTP